MSLNRILPVFIFLFSFESMSLSSCPANQSEKNYNDLFGCALQLEALASQVANKSEETFSKRIHEVKAFKVDCPGQTQDPSRIFGYELEPRLRDVVMVVTPLEGGVRDPGAYKIVTYQREAGHQCIVAKSNITQLGPTEISGGHKAKIKTHPVRCSGQTNGVTPNVISFEVAPNAEGGPYLSISDPIYERRRGKNLPKPMDEQAEAQVVLQQRLIPWLESLLKSIANSANAKIWESKDYMLKSTIKTCLAAGANTRPSQAAGGMDVSKKFESVTGELGKFLEETSSKGRDHRSQDEAG